MPQYPDVPTLKELGYPSLIFQSCYILSGPKNMERPVVKRLADAFRNAMATPGYRKLAEKLEIWTNKPLKGSDLKEGMIRRSKGNAEICENLGMRPQ